MCAPTFTEFAEVVVVSYFYLPTSRFHGFTWGLGSGWVGEIFLNVALTLERVPKTDPEIPSLEHARTRTRIHKMQSYIINQ